MGYLADKLRRKWFLLTIALIWTLSTATAYFCNSFTEILITRIIFAIFFPGCTSISISLNNSYFGQTQMLSRANSVFSFGVYFGAGLGSLTLILDKELGWRVSVLVVCGICMIFALLILSIKEPADVKKIDYKV